MQLASYFVFNSLDSASRPLLATLGFRDIGLMGGPRSSMKLEGIKFQGSEYKSDLEDGRSVQADLWLEQGRAGPYPTHFPGFRDNLETDGKTSHNLIPILCFQCHLTLFPGVIAPVTDWITVFGAGSSSSTPVTVLMLDTRPSLCRDQENREEHTGDNEPLKYWRYFQLYLTGCINN